MNMRRWIVSLLLAVMALAPGLGTAEARSGRYVSVAAAHQVANQVQQRLVVFPTYAHPDDLVYLSGGPFPQSAPVVVTMFCESWFYSPYGRWSWTVPARRVRSGTITAWGLRVPTPLFPGETNVGSLQLSPRLTVNTASADPAVAAVLAGSRVTISGRGFSAGEDVRISTEFPLSPRPSMGGGNSGLTLSRPNRTFTHTVVASKSGTFSQVTVKVPTQATHSRVDLTATGTQSGRRASANLHVIGGCRLYVGDGLDPFRTSAAFYTLPDDMSAPSPAISIAVKPGKMAQSPVRSQDAVLSSDAPGTKLTYTVSYPGSKRSIRGNATVPWSGSSRVHWAVPPGVKDPAHFKVIVRGKLGPLSGKSAFHLQARHS